MKRPAIYVWLDFNGLSNECLKKNVTALACMPKMTEYQGESNNFNYQCCKYQLDFGQSNMMPVPYRNQFDMHVNL